MNNSELIFQITLIIFLIIDICTNTRNYNSIKSKIESQDEIIRRLSDTNRDLSLRLFRLESNSNSSSSARDSEEKSSSVSALINSSSSMYHRIQVAPVAETVSIDQHSQTVSLIQ